MSQVGKANTAILPPGTVVQTLTGDAGGAVGPDGGNNINLIGGGGITVTGNPFTNTLTITGASSFTWQEVVAGVVNLAVNNGYVLNNAGGVTATLPAVAAIGDLIRIIGKGVGGWSIAQNGGQTCYFDAVNATTTGVAGSITATDQYDCIDIICITANTDFKVLITAGNPAIV